MPKWGLIRYVQSLRDVVLRTVWQPDSGSAKGQAERPEISEIPPVPASVKEAENSLRQQNYETAYAWDAEGNYRFGRNGKASSVSLSDEEAAQVKDSLFLHNHPGGATFSRPDIRFISDLNPGEFRVITPNHRFNVKRPEEGWPRDLWEQWENAFRIGYGRNKRDFDRGKIKEQEFNRRVYRFAIRRVAADCGLDYTEEGL